MYGLENLIYKNAVVGILVIILVIAAYIGLFFLFRAITCWYLKINKILKELQKSNEYLERIAIAAERGANVPPMGRPYGNGPVASAFQPGATIIAPEAVNAVQHANIVAEPPKETQAPEQRTCKQCGAVLQDGAAFCVQCGTRN